MKEENIKINMSVPEKIMIFTSLFVFIGLAIVMIWFFHDIGHLIEPFSILIISLILFFAFLPLIRVFIIKKKE